MSRNTSMRISRTAAVALIATVLPGFRPNPLSAAPPNPPAPPTVVVTTSAELEAALSPANVGARILVRAGEYDVSQALTVPDGATVVGEGVMSFDASGLPAGFEPSGRTLIRSTAALVGDVLTLGDGSTLRGLAIEDVAGRAGNPVAVRSREAGDFISARIEECEIVNPNPSGGTQSPTGRAIVVMTLNPVVEPPHEGAVLWVEMTHSIVRSPGAGVGVFAINFASHTEIRLDLESNVVGGGLSCVGGVGRPDAVTGAGLVIQSSRNLYRSDSAMPTAIGWQLFGGADSPGIVVSQASTFNSLQIHSIDDTLAGFATGIAAVGGRRFSALSGTISSNRIELNLHGTLLQTKTTDWRLFGALALVNVSSGDENTAHVVVRQATGSGPRNNLYADSSAPTPGAFGVGNRLEIVGDANAFAQTSENFDPPPPAEFFTAGR
jgi:hypothetical protein